MAKTRRKTEPGAEKVLGPGVESEYLRNLAAIPNAGASFSRIYFYVGSWLYRVGNGGMPDAQTTVIEVRNAEAVGGARGAYLIFGPTPTNTAGQPIAPAFDPTHQMLYVFYRLDQLAPIHEMLAGLGSGRDVYVFYDEFGPTKWAEVHSIMRAASFPGGGRRGTIPAKK